MNFSKAAALMFAASVGAGSAHAKNTVDVLVLYIDQATQTSNGRDIDARIASYIEYSNQAYENSNVDMRLRLVGAEKINSNYVYVNSSNLDSFSRNNTVASLRQKYGADLVTLINLREPMNGGYVCGIGYVPPGNSSSGQLYSNAASAGFSLVGVDCGYSTFTHELGHNMSLGHSAVQNSQGGIWSWARGHGVYGSFSTIMAYPQAYNTRNQLQMMSNPDLNKCEGQACGVSAGQSNGADAAQNLRKIGDQIAAFFPTKIDDGGDGDDNGDDNGGDDNGGDDGGDNGDNGDDTTVCSKPELNDNLVEDGDFNELSSWTSYSNAGDLGQAYFKKDCGRDYILEITNRSAYYAGAYQKLTGKLKAGVEYKLTAKLGLGENGSRENMRVVFKVSDDSGTHYQYLSRASFTNSEMSKYERTFTLDAKGSIREVGMLIYGASAGVDMLVDEVKIAPLNRDGDDGDDNGGDTSNPGGKEIINEGFENGTRGWSNYFGTKLYLSDTAASGKYSLLSNYRYRWYSGPGFNAHGLLEAGKSYQVSADVYLTSSRRSSDKAELWVYYVDNSGGHWKKLGGQDIATSQWQNISGELNLSPNGTISQLRLHVIGAQPSTSMYIDNLKVISK
ncbi:carbohydrate binding domain-containing protein [Hahella sp. HN01]|uniref:carbohydrate binding domain-containing protein n=1 Tax=unclassified Hahella TaxID=2624107 RepID=UPI001C1EEFB0|nr:carbohydrate binding domain-containing protein [Hahella sp. HN01]MBU6954910.1 carbohydrate binding domain-containing protein [Hahella sp. HN01]